MRAKFGAAGAGKPTIAIAGLLSTSAPTGGSVLESQLPRMTITPMSRTS